MEGIIILWTEDMLLTEGLMKILESYWTENLEIIARLNLNQKFPPSILSLTIIGDGRKLLMSNHPVSYLTYYFSLIGALEKKKYDGSGIFMYF